MIRVLPCNLRLVSKLKYICFHLVGAGFTSMEHTSLANVFKGQQEAVGRTEWPRKASSSSGGLVVGDRAGSCFQGMNSMAKSWGKS